MKFIAFCLLACISTVAIHAQKLNSSAVLETAADAVPGGRVLTGVLGIGKKEQPPPTTVVVQSQPVSTAQAPLTDAGAQQTLHEIIGHLRQENNSLRQQVLDEKQEKASLKDRLAESLEGAGVPHSALISAIVCLVLAVAGNIFQIKHGKGFKVEMITNASEFVEDILEGLSGKGETSQNKEEIVAIQNVKSDVVSKAMKFNKKINKVK